MGPMDNEYASNSFGKNMRHITKRTVSHINLRISYFKNMKYADMSRRRLTPGIIVVCKPRKWQTF